MYKVSIKFKDKLDNFHLYNVGDVYPRDGYTPTEKRIEYLKVKHNGFNKPFIEEVKQKKKKKED